MTTHLQRKSGFALAESLVAAGLLGMIAIFSATMTLNTQRAIKASTNVAEKNIVSTQIQHILSDENLCAAALRDINGAPAQFQFPTNATTPATGIGNVKQIFVGDRVLASTTQTGQKFKITSMSLIAQPGSAALPDTDVALVSGQPTVPVRQALARLNIAWDEQSSAGYTAFGSKHFEQDYVLTLQAPVSSVATTGPNGFTTVSRCFASSSRPDTNINPAQLCNDLGGRYDPALTPIKCYFPELVIASNSAEIQAGYSQLDLHPSGRAGSLFVNKDIDVIGKISSGSLLITKDQRGVTAPNAAITLMTRGDPVNNWFFPRLDLKSEYNNLSSTKSNDWLGMITFGGRNGNAAAAQAMPSSGGNFAMNIGVRATANWDTTNTPARMEFNSWDGATARNNMTLYSNGDLSVSKDLSIGGNLKTPILDSNGNAQPYTAEAGDIYGTGSNGRLTLFKPQVWTSSKIHLDWQRDNPTAALAPVVNVALNLEDCNSNGVRINGAPSTATPESASYSPVCTGGNNWDYCSLADVRYDSGGGSGGGYCNIYKNPAGKWMLGAHIWGSEFVDCQATCFKFSPTGSNSSQYSQSACDPQRQTCSP